MFIVSLHYLASSLNSLVITSRHNSLTSVTRSPHFFNSLISLSSLLQLAHLALFACHSLADLRYLILGNQLWAGWDYPTELPAPFLIDYVKAWVPE
jgi:hypothetical protein